MAAPTGSSDPFIVKKDDANLKSGSVYYTSAKKNEVLLKASVWGNVQFPGVHYIPLGTRFLEALSIAGGPLDSANLEEIQLSTRQEDKIIVETLSIEKALADQKYNPVLKPEDIVLVKEDKSYQKTALYLQVGTFILSVAAFGLLLDQRNK